MKALLLGLSYCLFFGWAGFRSYDVYQLASRSVPSVPKVKVEVNRARASSPEGRWEAPDGALEFYIECRGSALLVDGSRTFVASSDREWVEQNPNNKVPDTLYWDPDADSLQYQSANDAGGQVSVDLERVP